MIKNGVDIEPNMFCHCSRVKDGAVLPNITTLSTVRLNKAEKNAHTWSFAFFMVGGLVCVI